MARGRKRGGTQTPARPAAVSGPGALSARTDGGPGSASQPVRPIPGQEYGEGQALTDLQQSAPMAVAGGGSPAANPQGSSGSPAPLPGSPFAAGPSTVLENPADQRMLMPDNTVDDLLRALYREMPHPDILRLIRDGA